jgi:hypothetical protein
MPNHAARREGNSTALHTLSIQKVEKSLAGDIGPLVPKNAKTCLFTLKRCLIKFLETQNFMSHLINICTTFSTFINIFFPPFLVMKEKKLAVFDKFPLLVDKKESQATETVS